MGHLSDPFIKTRLSGAPLRSLGSLPLCVSKHITVNGMENSFLSSFKPALAAPRSGGATFRKKIIATVIFRGQELCNSTLTIQGFPRVSSFLLCMLTEVELHLTSLLV